MNAVRIKSLLVLFTLLAVGCESDGLSSLSGTITFAGNPVASGSLNLVPKAGGPNVGSAIVDGAYVIEDIHPGKYKANIMGFEQGKVVTSQAELQRMAEAGETPGEPREIPGNAKGNGIEFEVTPGKNTRDFALTP